MMRGGGSIVALGLVACSGATGELPSELGDCAEGTELVWVDAQAVLGAHCTRCHAEGLAEGERGGAPLLVNLDSEQAATLQAFAGWAQVWGGDMPTDAAPVGEAEAWILWEWWSCAANR